MDRGSERLWIAALVIVAGLVTAARLWMIGSLELSPDEAYYWQWSRTPSLSYPDHPPLIAWLIWIGTSLAGASETGVRLMTPLIAAAAVPISFRLAREVGLETGTACLASLVATLLPAPAAGALIATPDTPLALLWLLATIPLVRLAARPRPRDWYALGAMTGVALYAKLSALLLPLCALIVLLVVPPRRRQLATPHPWLALGLVLLIVAPMLFAGAAQGFDSVSLQLAHLSGALPLPEPLSIPERLLALIGGQLGLLTPVVAVLSVIAIRRGWSRPDTAALVVAVFVPLGATGLSALFTHPEQNWASLGHPAAVVLAFSAISRNRTAWLAATCSTVLAVTAIIHVHALRPFLPLPPERDPVSRLHGWEALGAIESPSPGHDAVVADSYGLAAEAAWQLRENAAIGAISALDRPSAPPPPGRWLLLSDASRPVPDRLVERCRAVTHERTLKSTRGDGQQVRSIDLSRGTDCRWENSLSDE